ncbi:unnamed protein product [Hymenolepis diminuta]|uniref:RING-type domain-containing protein n=1 Tax=Hymenolepis diminuta TaxID=6216 RepID=A0A564Z4Z8_HYMDI|nr:unnamed protein product [Hymenolepis diminuta]
MEATGSDAKDSDDLCLVCLQNFQSPVGRPESCTHVFCLSCIEEAARRKNECPLCRRRFRHIQVSEHIGRDIIKTIAISGQFWMLSELVRDDSLDQLDLTSLGNDAEIDQEELNALSREWISSVMSSIERSKNTLLSIFNLEGENCTLNSIKNTLLNGDEHIYRGLSEELERLHSRLLELHRGETSLYFIMGRSLIEFAQLPPIIMELEDLMAKILMEAGLEPRFTLPMHIRDGIITPDVFMGMFIRFNFQALHFYKCILDLTFKVIWGRREESGPRETV